MDYCRHTRHFFRLSLALVIGLGLAIPGAYADNLGWTPASKTVSYADLDLSTPAGTAQLYRRIRYAAKDICTLPDRGSLSAKSQMWLCEKRAIDTAVGKVGNPNLTAYHIAQSSGHPASVWSNSLDASNVAPR